MFSQVSPDSFRVFQIFSESPNFFQILSDFFLLFRIFPDAFRCFRIVSDSFKDTVKDFHDSFKFLGSIQVLLKLYRYFQIPPNFSKFFQIFLDSSRFSQIPSNSFKCFQIFLFFPIIPDAFDAPGLFSILSKFSVLFRPFHALSDSSDFLDSLRFF